VAIAFLVALTAIVFGDVLFFGRCFYYRDLTRYYYPTAHIVRNALSSGQMPYWNRLFSAGQPLAANPEFAVFYPPRWLLLLPDFYFGFRLHVVLHFFIAAIGMILLLRSARLGLWSSLLGSVTFTLGGILASIINLLPLFFGLCWLPWIFLFLRRALFRGTVRDTALAALFLGVQSLAFEPVIFLQTAILIGLYAAFVGWNEGRSPRLVLRKAGSACAVIMGGLAVASVQVIPVIDHLRDSARSRGLSEEMLAWWSFPFARLPEVFFPHLFGHVTGIGFWGKALYPSEGGPFLFSIYSGGFVAVCLITALICLRKHAAFWPMLSVAVLFFVLALGSYSPISPLIRLLPLFRVIRFPEKMLMIWNFLFAVAAAFTFEEMESNARARRVAVACASALGLFSLIALTVVSMPLSWAFLQDLSPGAPAVMQSDWVRCVLLYFALALLFRSLGRSGSAVFRALLVSLVVVDLSSLSSELAPRQSRSFFESTPPVVTTLSPDTSSYRLFHQVEWHGPSPISRRYFANREGTFWLIRNGLFPRVPAQWGIQTVFEIDVDQTNLLPTVDLLDSMWRVEKRNPDWLSIFAAMANIRYRAAFVPYKEAMARARGSWSRVNPIVLVPFSDAPRYYFADQIEQIRGRDDFVEQLSTSRWSPRVAFVSFPPFVPAQGSVSSVSESQNGARIEVQASGKSFLVASVTPHKYWSATVDGAPAELQVTNVGFQGLIVPGGRHTVEMIYRNPLVLAGAVMSMLALCVIAAVSLRRPSAAGDTSLERL
jgi:hypothetical protein